MIFFSTTSIEILSNWRYEYFQDNNLKKKLSVFENSSLLRDIRKVSSEGVFFNVRTVTDRATS